MEGVVCLCSHFHRLSSCWGSGRCATRYRGVQVWDKRCSQMRDAALMQWRAQASNECCPPDAGSFSLELRIGYRRARCHWQCAHAASKYIDIMMINLGMAIRACLPRSNQGQVESRLQVTKLRSRHSPWAGCSYYGPGLQNISKKAIWP